MTQWVPAPAGGVIGLQYASLPLWLDVIGVASDKRAHVLAGLQVMEREAVQRINRKLH